jgi:hypothetical protein
MDSIFVKEDRLERVVRAIVSYELPSFTFRALVVTVAETRFEEVVSFLILATNSPNHSTILRMRRDSIAIPTGSNSFAGVHLQIADVNYDSYKDIVLSLSMSETGQTYDNYCYLYEPSAAQFVEDDHVLTPFLREPIDIDIAKREIQIAGRIGWDTYRTECYKWDNGVYSLYAKEYAGRVDDLEHYVR